MTSDVPTHGQDGWHDEPLSLPKMDVMAPDRFPGPIGFVDFDRLRAKAENGRNVSERRCQITRVRLR